MKVERLYTRNVVGVSRGESLRTAAETMRRFHVGSLLVMEPEDGREVAGIVTDRDLVVSAMADGLDPRRTHVEKVMTPVVASVGEEADALDALERMRNAGVRRLLVTGRNGLPAGILSIDDIVDGLAAELASASELMKAGVRHERAA
jgi:predicted transcriptional regulator